jgi:hypothetical protein
MGVLVNSACNLLTVTEYHSGAPAVEFVKILLAAKALPLFSKVSGMVEGEAMCKAARPHFLLWMSDQLQFSARNFALRINHEIPETI